MRMQKVGTSEGLQNLCLGSSILPIRAKTSAVKSLGVRLPPVVPRGVDMLIWVRHFIICMFTPREKHDVCLDCGGDISNECDLRRKYGFCNDCEQQQSWQNRISDVIG